MIIFLLLSYIAVLALFVWLKFIPLNTFWKMSPLVVLLALNLGLFIPMGWGAPSGPVVVVRNSVQIASAISGEIIDVPVIANTPVPEGDVLFRIDPTTYEAQVGSLAAQLQFAKLRLSQMSELQHRGAGRAFDTEQRQAEVDQLEAQLAGAKWNLDKTTVRAPADGYVTNLALRKGAHVAAQSPAMAFIDTAGAIFGMEVAQIYARYINAGQLVEVTFKVLPGQIYTGRVEGVIQAVASGQVQPGGSAISPTAIQAMPFVVRIKLDNENVARQLPAGSTGTAAVYTDHVKVSHIIRKVILRQTAILNYLNPL